MADTEISIGDYIETEIYADPQNIPVSGTVQRLYADGTCDLLKEDGSVLSNLHLPPGVTRKIERPGE